MIENTFLNLVHFSSGKAIETFQKDGRQQMILGAYLAQRFDVLELQWLSTGRASPIPFNNIGLGIAWTRMGAQFARLFLKGISDYRSMHPKVFYIHKRITSLEVCLDKILNHTQLVVNVACLTSYVVMIALGHTLVGGLGLVGFGLLIIKKARYLPGYIEKYIIPLEVVSSVYTGVVSQVHVINKVFLLVCSLIECLDYISRNEFLNQSFSKFTSNKFGRAHQIRELVGMDWESKIDSVFRVNYSSLHSKELEQIFSRNDKDAVKAMDVHLKYEELEQRSQLLGVAFNHAGWKKIKDAVIYDCSSDDRPINFDYGLELLKVLLMKMSKENDEQFSKSMIELSEIGESCFEGWLRDIGVMLNPEVKDDFSWAVHNQLAVMRDGLLMESLPEVESNIQKFSEEQISLSAAGGIDGVHLVDVVAIAIWHKWRTYKGEVLARLYGRSFFERLFQKGADIELDAIYGPHNKVSFIEQQFRRWGRFSDAAIAVSGIQLPIPILGHMITSLVEKCLRAEYNIERMVNTLYDAIKPQYVDVIERGSISHQSLRKIEWGAITSWFSALYNKDIDITGDFHGFNPEIVALDDHGNFFLTEKGVKLLLWDLGIIETV